MNERHETKHWQGSKCLIITSRCVSDSVHNSSGETLLLKMENVTLGADVNANLSVQGSPYKTVEIVFISVVTGSLSLVTVVGNILVMLSIKVNRQLQTVNNYFLFSLACADLIIAIFSMNLYTIYIIKGFWPLGAVVCDLWLAVDYVASNASVMNLLIISFDRYFCVTKPLTYPARRTNKMAGLMIAAAWILSFVLWAPAILFWKFVVGERTVKEGQCYIQFLSNPVVTFGTAIAAFYLPVVIMTVLYIQVSVASRSRIRSHQAESKVEKTSRSSNLLKSYFSRQQNNNNAAKASLRDTVKNGQLEDKASANPGSASHQEKTSNESSSASTVQSIPKADVVQNAQPPALNKMQSSKWSRIKIVTKQSGNECVTAIEIMPGNATHNTVESKPGNVARKFANIARSQVRKRRQVAAREKKVTRTIFAILLAFILTWTPYNVMVLISTFCELCVPETVWVIGYWLCYINSTVNPACYALCNITFKKTFKQLLLCKYKNINAR